MELSQIFTRKERSGALLIGHVPLTGIIWYTQTNILCVPSHTLVFMHVQQRELHKFNTYLSPGKTGHSAHREIHT